MSIYQVVIKGRYGEGNQLRNIRHYEFPDYTPSEAEAQEFVDNLDDDLKDYLQGFFNNDVHIDSYGLRRVDIAEQPEADIVPTAGAWDGTNSADNLAAQLCGLVTWKAFSTYPRTARNYMFPFTETNNSASGLPDATVQAAMLGYADDSMSIVITGQENAHAVTVQYGSDPRAVVDYNILTTVAVASFWATQRRRRPGVGA